LFLAVIFGAVTLTILLISMFMAVLIGTVSSLVPRFNAARVSILDALRYNG
jgi:ABC-type antimicrobial peptide transport system permease subunit